eukprot:scaffold82047_cov31-Tisochrysis_lutea.AAC.4
MSTSRACIVLRFLSRGGGGACNFELAQSLEALVRLLPSNLLQADELCHVHLGGRGWRGGRRRPG